MKHLGWLFSIAAMSAGGGLLLIGLACVPEDAVSPICPAQTSIDLGVLLRGAGYSSLDFGYTGSAGTRTKIPPPRPRAIQLKKRTLGQ